MISMTATAADNDWTVSKVEFYNSATLLGTTTTAPYTYSWINVAVVSYTLTAKIPAPSPHLLRTL
jgi:hypothetical protein